MTERRSGPAPSSAIEMLLELMAALRTPGTGCAWDLAQDFASIAPFTIEEAYEVADAIARADLDDLRDELGDLLLQVVFHARLAEERGAFGFGDVVEAITAKLVRRHPHVFGDRRDLSAAEVKALWAEIKAAEKLERAARPGQAEATRAASVLDDVPLALPALTRADKLGRKAAAVGFTWPDVGAVIAKVEEELAELRRAIDDGRPDEIGDELGDVLFSVANLGRYVDVDPGAALAGTNRKFQRRFQFVEAALERRGLTAASSTLDEMERLWAEAKEAERAPVSPRVPRPESG